MPPNGNTFQTNKNNENENNNTEEKKNNKERTCSRKFCFTINTDIEETWHYLDQLTTYMASKCNGRKTGPVKDTSPIPQPNTETNQTVEAVVISNDTIPKPNILPVLNQGDQPSHPPNARSPSSFTQPIQPPEFSECHTSHKRKRSLNDNSIDNVSPPINILQNRNHQTSFTEENDSSSDRIERVPKKRNIEIPKSSIPNTDNNQPLYNNEENSTIAIDQELTTTLTKSKSLDCPNVSTANIHSTPFNFPFSGNVHYYRGSNGSTYPIQYDNITVLICAKETASQTGLIHLQGYIEFTNPMGGFQELKFLLHNNTAEISVAVDTRDENIAKIKKKDQNPILYFNKPNANGSTIESFVLGHAKYKGFSKDAMKKNHIKDYINVSWKPWQQHIVDMCETEPDGRKIYWCWESEGYVGKTYLAEYLILKYDGIIHSRSLPKTASSIQKMAKKGKWPKVIICDLPRQYIRDGWHGYMDLEKLNKKIVMCSRPSCHIIYKPFCHIIVFAHTQPNKVYRRSEKWNIIKIDEFENDIHTI
ncbi:unnamed protein product [Phytomonas sp. Hart1]|nr:unnamed protein product [Phytomonas sp. Hart1]|eukprot:CCW72165.1 unnamed protein product [Phytomonas sp. isolate Hart1]